jgi:hypothetical protein
MVAAWRPDLAVQAAWNADPNDPAAVPTWTDLTSLFLGASAIKRGKQYELDLAQASQPTADFLDPNEYLNPGNPSSPYAPNLLPLRQVLMRAMWPNGGTGNLLPGQGIDPSFESYTVGAVLPWILTTGAGVAPAVSNVNPQQGANNVSYNVTAGAGTSGVGLVVNCIPGRQYTSSLWVRQGAANTTQIFINGGASGSSTTAVATYTRLTVTWTATQPTHQLWVASFTTSLSGVVRVDAIQHEPGATATAFTTSGPTIYPIFLDYIERLPSEWDQDTEGYLGLCEMGLVDAFAPLTGVELWTELRNAILAKSPTYYWPLNEAQGATTFVEASGNGGPALTRMDGPFGPGPTFAAGTQINVPGDPSGTGLASNTNGVSTNVPASVAQAGLKIGSTPINFGGSATFSWSAGFILSRTTPITPGGQSEFAITLTQATNLPRVALFQLYTDSIPSVVNVNVQAPGLVGASINVAPDIWADGHPHLYVLTGSISATTVTVNLWIDGALYGTASNSAVSGYTSPLIMDVVEVGGYLSPKTQAPGAAVTAGVYSHVALWNRVLSSSEIADLNYAFGGYINENSGARITRYLGYGWNGATAIDTGQSAMGVSNLTAGTTLLQACQNVTTSENGNFFVDKAGTVTFQSRGRRYLATTPAYVFGERTDLGELPYQGDVKFEFDLAQIYNDIAVTRSSGGNTASVATAVDATSKLRYFPSRYPRTVNVASDLEAQDAANWLLNTHKNPVQRVEKITLAPVGYPALWPVVLGLELGTRVTVKKRSPAANNGAGLTQSGDFFIESIEHTGIDMEAGTWTTTLLLSPAAPALQPWILGDATYGQLGITTVLGY